MPVIGGCKEKHSAASAVRRRGCYSYQHELVFETAPIDGRSTDPAAVVTTAFSFVVTNFSPLGAIYELPVAVHNVPAGAVIAFALVVKFIVTISAGVVPLLKLYFPLVEALDF